MNLNDLTPEFKEKALECKSTSELLELAESEGLELSDEQLEAVSGGVEWSCAMRDCSNNKSW